MSNRQEAIQIKSRLRLPAERSFFSKFCLPVLLFFSFVWLYLYTTLSDINDVLFVNETFSSLPTYLIFSVLFVSLVDYLVFELEFFVYRLFIGFSIYSFMIPKNVLIDKFRMWYIFRNLILGLVFNLRFFFPFIGTYLIIIELIANFAFIFLLFNDLKKDYVEPIVGQYVFKTLVLPVILYEIYIVITQMVGVL